MNKYIAIVFGLVLGAFPDLVLAQLNPCPLGSLACPGGDADQYFATILVFGAKVAFAGTLFGVFVWYGFKLIVESDSDQTVGEVYNAYAYAAVGTIFAGAAFMFANTFAVPGQLVNPGPTNNVLFGVINTFRALLFAVLVFNIFYQGYRLVSSQDDSQVEKAKKQFVYGMVGAAIAILADRVVFAFSGVAPGLLSLEAIGIANFVGTILGAFALIALFVAGMWLVFAVNEQNKDKAKKIILTAFVVLAITMISLALIRITATEAPF